MNPDDLEFRLSQYLDGTLPVDQAAALFEELSSNPQAMALLDEYRRLDLLLKGQTIPAINYDALADSISGAIDDDAAERMKRRFMAGVSAPWRVAIAAMILVAIGAVWLGVQTDGILNPVEKGVAQIQGPQAEVAAAPAVAQIEIGPGSLAVDQANAYQYADVFARPGRVVIARSDEPRDDSNAPR